MSCSAPGTLIPVSVIIIDVVISVILITIIIQSDQYKETLPFGLSPSYRGSCLKYSYKVTIGTQKVGCPIKLLRIPFRVLVVPGGRILLAMMTIAFVNGDHGFDADDDVSD